MINRRSSSGLVLSEVLAGCSKELFEVWSGLICFRLLTPQFAVLCIDALLKDEFVCDTDQFFACIFIVGRSIKGYSAIDLLVKRFDRLVWMVSRAHLRIIRSKLSGRDVTIIGKYVFDQSPGGDVRVTN